MKGGGAISVPNKLNPESLSVSKNIHLKHDAKDITSAVINNDISLF